MRIKIFILTILMLMFCQCGFAKTIPVEALSDFSTENPPKQYSVRVLENLYIEEEKILFNGGDILEGKIIDVSGPKRLKRDGGFTFVPVKCISIDGSVTEITKYYPAKYTTKLDRGGIAKSAVLTVGNHFVKGLSMGVSTIEGVVKNEKDNRFKSGVNSLYESSPLSYVEKGHHIVIEKEQCFLLNFKIKNEDEEDLPNYEYTPLESDKIQNET